MYTITIQFKKKPQKLLKKLQNKSFEDEKSFLDEIVNLQDEEALDNAIKSPEVRQKFKELADLVWQE